MDMTKWKDIKNMLKGRNKGSNLIALGVFLVTLGASYQIVETVNMTVLRVASDLLIMFGMMSFFVGFFKYVFEK
jgi:hypothetical protein